MKISLCIPKRRLDEDLVVHFCLGEAWRDQNTAFITGVVTPELIQELRDTAGKAEDMMKAREREAAIAARIKAEMEAEKVEGAA